MKLIKVGAAVLNQTPRDWDNNFGNIVLAIREARKQGVSVLCLPEMCITGYGLEDDLFCSDVSRRAITKLVAICDEVRPRGIDSSLVVCVGLPIIFNNTLYNAVATIVNGKVAGFTCKQHLAGDGLHYEQRHFKPWPQSVVQTIEIIGEPFPVPIGDIHFNIGDVKIGYEICEDAWIANRPGTVLASKGVDIYLNPSASHFSFGKLNTRKNFVVDGSRAFSATYIYSNLIGNESGRAIYDGGALIATGGTLIAQGKRFSYERMLLTTAVVDVDNTRTSQVRTASFQPNVEAYNKGCVQVSNFTFPPISEKVTSEPEAIEAWEVSKDIKHEECTRAIGLSLMDYMRKSHTKGFVISLSGGSDSAMVTYLCAKGIELGCHELGTLHFYEKYCPHLKDNKDNYYVKDLCRNLITTAYQATENSGNVTKHAARSIANMLNVKHFEFDVQPMFEEYKKLGALIKGSELNFQDNDIVLQNLQARVRSPSIWIIANIEGKLLLTTSNMSEAAVGYTTADGDLSGCIAPIAGLSKTYIREYLKWVAYDNHMDTMQLVIKQQPTAELRPSEYNQTDEDDLMPYDLLHKIEVMTMKNRYTPLEIYKILFPDNKYDKHILCKYIVKFFNLFCINQWKREKIPVSFHMDDHNLDPRSWARLPILNSGCKEEIKDLKEYVNNS